MERMHAVIFCLAGFLFVSAFGALSHFFYKWSGKKKSAALLFAANESTWEHLKLALFPTFLFFAVGLPLIEGENKAVSFFLALAAPMLLIPAVFYSYTALTGEAKLPADILIYFCSVAIAFGLNFRALTGEALPPWCAIAAAVGIALIAICYLTFTFHPPENFLFRDGRTGKYGPS